MGCTAPELATCRVRFSSFHSAKSMVTYCESSLRSCRASLSRVKHLRPARAAAGRGAHDAADQRGEQRRRRGLAADVAQHDGGLVGTVVEKVVEVAADGARGQKAHGHLGVWHARAASVRQQAQLHLARHGDVALQLPLLARDRLVEARVLNGDGHLRGQRGQHALVLFVEEAGARVLQVEHADDAALVEERHDQLGAGLGIHGQVARVLAHVGNIDRAATRAPPRRPGRW